MPQLRRNRRGSALRAGGAGRTPKRRTGPAARRARGLCAHSVCDAGLANLWHAAGLWWPSGRLGPLTVNARCRAACSRGRESFPCSDGLSRPEGKRSASTNVITLHAAAARLTNLGRDGPLSPRNRISRMHPGFQEGLIPRAERNPPLHPILPGTREDHIRTHGMRQRRPFGVPQLSARGHRDESLAPPFWLATTSRRPSGLPRQAQPLAGKRTTNIVSSSAMHRPL